MIFRYDNDSVFEGAWEDAPGYGLQTVVFNDPIVGPSIRHQGDYFRLDEDGDVVNMDHASLMRYIVDELKIVKVGSMCSRHKWKRIYDHSKEDLEDFRSR